MIIKTKVALFGLVFSALFSSSGYAHTPLSYNDMVQAERARMQANHPRSSEDKSAVREGDEKWLLNTPATWGYMVNKERLRMKQSLPQAAVQPATSPYPQPKLMPTTLNEGVRQHHEQMKKSQKSQD